MSIYFAPLWATQHVRPVPKLKQNKPLTAPKQRSRAAHLRWIVASLLMPSLGGFVLYKVLSSPSDSPLLSMEQIATLTEQATPELPIPSLAQPQADTPLVSTVEFVVRRNDTLERIFRQLQINVQDLAAIREFPEVRRALDMLKPGDPLTFSHDDKGDLQSLSRQVDNTTRLSITRDAEGFKAQLIETPLDARVTAVRGTVNNSLFESAQRAGLSAKLIMSMANDIFGWDIDFALDIREGDRFNVVYEKLYRNGTYLSDGKILAAEFINDGKPYRAVRFESADGVISNYFTPEGRSMHKQFLRAPLDFTRISSGFSLARFHPILNKVRAHKGVDYAAATGTPIKAAGDGKVIFQGWQTGYGNVVIIDHGSGITTLYGHLSRFNKQLRKGMKVNQGDLVGFVGMTGAATGPHLHYEYRINGVHKDPRTVPLPKAGPIPAKYMAEFQGLAGPLLTQLDRTSQQRVVAGPARR